MKFVIEVHHLAKGKYNVCFNICQKDTNAAHVDFDIVHNVLAFCIEYNDYLKKDSIILWPEYWGSQHFPGTYSFV